MFLAPVLSAFFIVSIANAAIADPFPIEFYPSLGKIVEESKNKDLNFTQRKELLARFSEETMKLASNLPENLDEKQVDRALPILEMKSLLFDFSVDRMRQDDCGKSLSLILAHSGREIASKRDLEGASLFLYSLIESNCK